MSPVYATTSVAEEIRLSVATSHGVSFEFVMIEHRVRSAVLPLCGVVFERL